MAIIFDQRGRPIDEDNRFPTSTNASGSLDLRGLAGDRPDADAVPVGSTYWSVDTGNVDVTDGTNWVAV